MCVQAPGLADEDGNPSTLPNIVVGVCAMEKKARSKPMLAVCKRLLVSRESCSLSSRELHLANCDASTTSDEAAAVGRSGTPVLRSVPWAPAKPMLWLPTVADADGWCSLAGVRRVRAAGVRR